MITKRIRSCPPPVLALMWLAGATSVASAQESAVVTTKTDQEGRWKEARSRVDKLQAGVKVKDQLSPLTFSREPIFAFTDPTRAENGGTLWLIGTEGRPQAILSLFLTSSEAHWTYEFTSLTTESLLIEKPDDWQWRPNESGLTLNDFAKTEPPAETAAGRLVQMKRLARDFSATEIYFDASQTELRLLPQPLLRYTDARQGIVDGVIFAFAHGTNPEILLLIETGKFNQETSGWRYGAARMAAAEVRLRLGPTEVWTAEGVRQNAHESPYCSFGEKQAIAKPLK